MKKYRKSLAETRHVYSIETHRREGKCHESDHSIVESCISDDPNAWSLLVRKYSRLIYSSISNRLRRYNFQSSYQDIEDIRQDVLISLWGKRKLNSIRNRQNISRWLAVVSGNAAVGYMRSKRFKEVRATVSLYDICSDMPSQFDYTIREENSKRMTEAIGALPTREKLMVTMAVYDDKKYFEIANMLNIPMGTVASCLKRARERLKDRELKVINRMQEA